MTLEELYQRYELKLNTQQIQAVKAVEGPVLLLAVPGSGKTTVLVNRLGYMIYCQGIAPENILTLTYTVAATKDMSQRFQKFFGDALGNRLAFRTINGLCATIINHYGRVIGKEPFRLVTEEKQISAIISQIYQKVENGYATESELATIRTYIAYIKNMMLSAEEMQKLNEEADCDIAEIYKQYNQVLRAQKLMDYDDQMQYAYSILRRSPEMLSLYQEKYRYICVDEAQDTSKIQHLIIELLASKYQNLFMVGDEDQSIYGFRAAYPQALLSFEKRYPNAKVLVMEENFRSNAKIVEAADQFIQENTLRHKKNMKASRPAGTMIREISLKSRSGQYSYLLKAAKDCKAQTAVLYRDNESAIPLIDLLERQNIPYRMRNADLSFFTNRVVLDIQNIITFSENDDDTELFLQIYYKMSTYLTKEKATQICKLSKEKDLPVLETAIRFAKLPPMTLARCKTLQKHLENIKTDDAGYAIQRILQYMGYADYLERSGISDSKLFVVRALARQTSSAREFVARLGELRELIAEKQNDLSCQFILSTIHSSKGLEYDTVYLMDVTDGIFPECVPENLKYADKKELSNYEEERRLFYVGVTRAKNHLYLFRLKGDATFLKQLLKGISYEKEADTPVKKKSQTSAASYLKPQEKKEKLFSQEDFQNYCDQLGEGIQVNHLKFGGGIISDMNEDKITIVFDVVGEKTFYLRYCYQKDLLKWDK